jgi:hypothetical protein
MFALCRKTTATAATPAKAMTGHDSSSSTAASGSESAATIDANEA